MTYNRTWAVVCDLCVEKWRMVTCNLEMAAKRAGCEYATAFRDGTKASWTELTPAKTGAVMQSQNTPWCSRPKTWN